MPRTHARRRLPAHHRLVRGTSKGSRKNYGRLLQLYGVHKAQIEARRKGLSTQRRTLADGSVKLVIGVIGGVA